MNVAYFPSQIALNAEPALKAFVAGCHANGITCIPNSQTADAAVIWSVVWNGRMRQNRQVYEYYRNQGKPVFVLEVGTLKRNTTWKLGINNTNGEGIFANDGNFIPNREKLLDLYLKPVKNQRKSEIIIACQHQLSQQWQNMPNTNVWIDQIIEKIRRFSRRPIVIRPHPRNPLRTKFINGASIEIPRRIPASYDCYNINFDYHCVINWNSGVAVQSAIEGTPIITGPTSLASEISGNFENIEGITLPDRTNWFNKILHTEWLLEELAQGIPQRRLLDKI